MRILVAPDSFKGSLAANQVGNVIKNALLHEIPHASVQVVPMADGGEGTVDALLFTKDGERVELEVTGATGAKVTAYYGVLNDCQTVVIEVAAVAGLTSVPENKRNPFHLMTVGIGECIGHALDQGFRRFIVGLGGSATNDGGIGMLQALGVTFTDEKQDVLPPSTRSLANVKSVDYNTIDPRIWDADIRVASDVNNPLCGPNGATHIFGPQKGAAVQQLERLDRNLATYADCIEDHLGRTYQNIPGAGAAGGLGFAFLTIGASVESGAALVAQAVDLEKRLHQCSWVITGEGKTDEQTLHGKLPYVVAQRAKQYNIPTILLSGSMEGDLELLYGAFDSMHAIANGPMSLTEAMEKAEYLLYHKARNIARLLKSKERLRQ